MIRACASLALIVAVAIVAIKTLLSEPLWWPFLIIEYASALTLATGAITVLRGGQSHLLVAGWAFTFSITWSTFFHHLAERPSIAQMLPVDFGLGLLLLTAFVCAGLSIVASRMTIKKA